MSGDGDLMRAGAAEIFKIPASRANGTEMTINDGIMHKLAEDGQRTALGGGMGGTQGVADAEAHAVMLG